MSRLRIADCGLRMGGAALCLGPLLLLPARPAAAWSTEGHVLLTEAAVLAAPGLPGFFREGAGAVARDSCDPDFAKNRGLPALRDGEDPEHYLDVELLKGKPLPATRYGFIHLCARMKIEPDRVGLIPYALAEATERLALSFAEYRQSPNDTHVQQKCLVWAGQMAHYAQDLCQPLHTTIHYDGKVKADGSSPRSGIHRKVDALIATLHASPRALAAGQKAAPVAQLMPAIQAQLTRSHSLVPRVYALEPKLQAGASQREVDAFAMERARESVRFTAALYATAWQLSAGLKLPSRR